MKIYAGIDPGVSGAIAMVFPSGEVNVVDTPTITVKSGKVEKKFLDLRAAADLLRPYANIRVVIEKVSAMPGLRKNPETGQMERVPIGGTSAFNFGMNYGAWLGIMTTLRIPYNAVVPRVWKDTILRSYEERTKETSLIHARKEFPALAKQLARKKDDGRAEALLMALYCEYHWKEPVRREPPQGDLFAKAV